MKCINCGKEKEGADFSYGRSVCRDCRRQKARESYQRNRAAVLEATAAYRVANRALVNERSRNKKHEKRVQRAMAGVGHVTKPRANGPRALHDAHVRLWATIPEPVEAFRFDAHVRRYRSVLKSREKYAARWVSAHDQELARVRAYKARLPDAYVLQRLALPSSLRTDVPKELLELKRDQLSMRRLARQLKDAAQNSQKENHEAIEQHT